MTDRRKAPTKAETALLAPFPGLPLERIVVPATGAQFAAAAADLGRSRFVGFDTESRPTFRKGEISDGPHIVQFATLDRAYIFQLHRSDCREVLVELLSATTVVKVGFDLKSDRGHLQRKLGMEPGAILDLDTLFRREGYHSVGVRAAVGMVLNQRFRKSKHVTTSNWGQKELTPRQLLYAANDAYAALMVLTALNLPESELPVSNLTPVSA